MQTSTYWEHLIQIYVVMIIATWIAGHYFYAVVTPLRKAASYEQRKTNLGNQNIWRRIIM